MNGTSWILHTNYSRKTILILSFENTLSNILWRTMNIDKKFTSAQILVKTFSLKFSKKRFSHIFTKLQKGWERLDLTIFFWLVNIWSMLLGQNVFYWCSGNITFRARHMRHPGKKYFSWPTNPTVLLRVRWQQTKIAAEPSLSCFLVRIMKELNNNQEIYLSNGQICRYLRHHLRSFK